MIITVTYNTKLRVYVDTQQRRVLDVAVVYPRSDPWAEAPGPEPEEITAYRLAIELARKEPWPHPIFERK